jgi:hypothetical protein
MWKAATFIACMLIGTGYARAQATEAAGDDDLSVVKRAVEKEDGAPAAHHHVSHRIDTAHWFRVRIEEKNGSRVKVNLPLALVRHLSDDLPDDWACGRWHRHCKLRLSEVLELLDAGQDLVEVKDGETTIRVWVE